MKTRIKKIASVSAILFFLAAPLSIFAEGPGGPGTGNGSGGPNNGQYLGGNAPIDGGLSIMLALSAAYGLKIRKKVK